MFSTLTKLLRKNSSASDTAAKYDLDKNEETNGCDTSKAIIRCGGNQFIDTVIKDIKFSGSDPGKSNVRARTSLLSYLTPISRSGSVPLRSNSSSASTQSFAFPDLSSLDYLKPVSRTGSVSLRSNSSSASTQSFAFPVVVSESYNSPVRMVKAETRCSKLRKRLLAFFMCCKF